MKNQLAYASIGIGLFFVLIISLIEGFSGAFYHMIEHLRYDLGELGIHIYILGLLLIFYGVYLMLKVKK